jgi:hypothetical protein
MTTRSIASSPLSAQEPIVVGSQGHVLFLGDPEEGGRVVLADSNGTVLARVGRTGSGPGEYRLPVPAFVAANSFVVHDPSLRRVTRWQSDGTLAQVSALNAPFIPAAFSETAAVGSIIDSAGVAALATVSLGDGTIRRLVDRAHPGFATAFPPVRQGQRYIKPAVGLASEGVLLGETQTVAISWWSPSGTPIRRFEHHAPPAPPSEARLARVLETIQAMRRRTGAPPVDLSQFRTTLRATPVPMVSDLSALHEDALGRVWMLGIAGDSAAAYVFGRDGFLGRLELGCRGFEGRWSLSGRWLALACAADGREHEGDAVLQLYRVQ